MLSQFSKWLSILIINIKINRWKQSTSTKEATIWGPNLWTSNSLVSCLDLIIKVRRKKLMKKKSAGWGDLTLRFWERSRNISLRSHAPAANVVHPRKMKPKRLRMLLYWCKVQLNSIPALMAISINRASAFWTKDLWITTLNSKRTFSVRMKFQ